jgi:hypothetical protein
MLGDLFEVAAIEGRRRALAWKDKAVVVTGIIDITDGNICAALRPSFSV